MISLLLWSIYVYKIIYPGGPPPTELGPKLLIDETTPLATVVPIKKTAHTIKPTILLLK